MEQKTQEAIGKQLQDAVMQQALDAAVAEQDATGNDQAVSKKRDGKQKKGGISPLTGQPTPPGRPPGVRNKLTNIRDAVLEAFDTVGGAEYLVRLANGTQSDRAAFTGLVAKVLPTQIQANVEGGIKLELSWLGGRSIGTTQAQIPEARTQVLDLEQDSTGGYRIKDPSVPPAGGDAAGGQAPEGPAGAQGQGT